MARYQVILSYDGTQFAGSQRQARARTVQGEFEAALRALGWAGGSILLAGRTDAGVHAAGQVAAFDLEWPHQEADLQRALNANLPPDLAVRGLRPAAADFHPRFQASSRTYRYCLFCEPVRDPLRERYAWRVWPAVDGRLLQAAAAQFVGRHDFSAYGRPPRRESSSVRTVLESRWLSELAGWEFRVQADAFLYRMVRRLVFVQVAVGQGRLAPEALAASLGGPGAGLPEGRLPAGVAPAQGLVLEAVAYDRDH